MHAAAQTRSEATRHGLISFVGDSCQNNPVGVGPGGRVVAPDYLCMVVRPRYAGAVDNGQVSALLHQDAGRLFGKPWIIGEHQRLREDWAFDGHRAKTLNASASPSNAPALH